MKQQINLFQPIFRRQRRVFSARAMLHAAAVVAVGLMLVYGYARWQVSSLESDVARLSQQRDAARTRLLALEQKIPTRHKSELLQAEVERLEREVAGKRDIVAAFDSGALGNQSGFSAYLEGFARQRVEGLWLTGFRIAEGGKWLRIRGSTLAPERVPVLVQRLAAEPVFSGMRFSTLRMERAGPHSERVDFVLQSAGDDSAGAGGADAAAPAGRPR